MPKTPGAKKIRAETEVRQARLDRRPMRRAAEQPTARQTRLRAIVRLLAHPRKQSSGQPKARQARLERLRELSVKFKMLGFAQWNAPASLL